MQGTQVRSLVGKLRSHMPRATKLVPGNWRACVPQLEKPERRSEDPEQTKEKFLLGREAHENLGGDTPGT